MKTEVDTVSSLLRVRKADSSRDMGTYTCSLHCQANHQPIMSHTVQICIKDSIGLSKLMTCTFPPACICKQLIVIVFGVAQTKSERDNSVICKTFQCINTN